MRAPLRIAWLCAVVVAAGCAVDSEGDDDPETEVPVSAAMEEPRATAMTAPSAATNSEAEPATTTADGLFPVEPPATDPAEHPASGENEAPPVEHVAPVPDTASSDEPAPEPKPEPQPETLLTWHDIRVIDLSATPSAQAGGTVTAPRLMSRFHDLEVLLHDQDRAWTFNPDDGSVLHEWKFKDTVPSVFPDGSGGIVFLQSSAIFHQAAPETDPETLVPCPGPCPRELLGVAALGDSRDVVYTHRDHFESPEGSNPHYEDVLHRISLNTRETVRLGVVGGYEWGTANTSVAGDTLFGYRFTEASQGWIGIDLQSSDSVAWCFMFESHETGRDCPRAVTGFADDLAVAYIDFTDPSESETYEEKIRVRALRSREADVNTHNIPIKMPSEVACVLNIEVWEPVAAINTSSQGPCWYYDYTQPHRSVLADFSTGEVELYSHPGFLRLVPRTKAPSEVESDTSLTWQGVPVIDVYESADTEPDGPITAPRLLRGFDDVEVLLLEQDRAWTFDLDGSVDNEWGIDEPSLTVFPDGASGIVYQHSSDSDHSVNRSSIHYREEPEIDPEVLVECTGDCTGLRMIGVVNLGDYTELVYTVESWPPLPEDAEYQYPTRTEVLHRMNLETREPVRLVDVGGWEWWFFNTIVVDAELFGAWGTDGGYGVVGYDLASGSLTYGGLETANRDCFDTNPSQDCPSFALAWSDSILTAFSGSDHAFVVDAYDRASEQHLYTIPVIMPQDVRVNSIDAWDSILVINTRARSDDSDSSQPRWIPHRAVLIDLETYEVEYYSHPGVLHVVPRMAVGSGQG